MLIPQNLALEQNENHSASYFIDPMLSPPSLAVSAPSSGHNSITGSVQGVYPPSDGYFVPSRVQSELPGLNIYPGQPGSSTISSPGNYPSVPGSVGTAPGLMGGHYSTGLEHSPYYGPLGDGYEMKPSVGEIWPGAYGQPPPAYYPYDNTFGTQYPYDRCYGMDINDGVRRKNATRESTNTLKNWLQEHKKNPYPTKGEKIMLAIITKMTLTQVSTWFANARRRLKKENKMTWVPKNRSNDANNAAGKKVEDDDETGSQHSQEDKSDIDPSIDSDDSDSRKVTSTNSNDVTINQTRLEGSDYQTDKISRVSDEVNIRGKPKFSSMPPGEQEQSSYSSFDRNNKSLWSPGNDKKLQHTEEVISDQTSSISQSFLTEGEYNTTSMNIKPQSSMLSPPTMLDHVDSTRLPSHCKYSPNWSASGYQDAVTSKAVSSSQVQTEKTLKEMDAISHRSPRLTDTKPFPPNPMFPMNRPQESISDARSSVTASSYLHGFSDQTQSTGSYRFSDQIGLPQNPAYYSQQNMNLRTSILVSDRNPPYPGNLENLQSKIGTLCIPTASSISLEQKHFHQQVSHLSSSTPYYPLEHLPKSATSSSVDSSFSSTYYQQESYNQLPSNIQATNVDYYPRKNEQLSGYSGSDGSPFPLHQASLSPRK